MSSDGLVNFGRTCYINATLQAFAAVPSIVNHIIMSSNECNDKFCNVCILSDLIQEMLNLLDTTNTLQSLVEKVLLELHCDENTNQDAEEVIYIMLGWIHTKTSIHKFPSYYYIEVRRTCLMCNFHHTTEIPDEGCIIELGLSGNLRLLKHLIQHYCDGHTDENCLCQNCGKRGIQQISRKFLIVPEVFCLVLKRFEFKDGSIIKNNDHFLFNDILNMTEFTTEEDRNISLMYQLHACIEHIGSTTNDGHYVTYTRYGNKWFCMNDTTVTSTTFFFCFNHKGVCSILCQNKRIRSCKKAPTQPRSCKKAPNPETNQG